MASYDLKAILGEKIKRLTDKTLKALIDCMCTVGASLCSLEKRISALESVEFPEGGYKPMQEPVASPNASGTAIQFIESMSQDASGRMTATKKTVQDGTTLQKGLVQLTDSHSSTSTNTAATPKNVKEAYDLANGKADPASVVDSAVYDASNHTIIFKHGSAQLFTLDAAAFVKDGMVDSVTIVNGNLVITFNTDAGKQPISIPLTDIFNPNNYYTKTDTDALLAEKTNVNDALAKEVKTGSYNLNNAAHTALYEVQSGNISNAPTGNGDRVVLLAGNEGGLIRQVLLGNDGIFWRTGAEMDGVVQMLYWKGPASDERIFNLEYKQSTTGVNYSVHMYGDGTENWFAHDVRFRLTRPQTSPEHLRVHMKISPTATSANPLYHGSVRAMSRHTFGLRDGSAASSSMLVQKSYNSIESTSSESDLGQEICDVECKLSDPNNSYCGVIEGDVKYYGTSALDVKRTVDIHYTVNYLSSYVQGTVMLYVFGEVRSKDFFEY